MTSNDTLYEGAKSAFTVYGWLVQELAAKLGWEKAIALQTGVGSRMGDGLAQLLRTECGQSHPQVTSFAAALENAIKNFGFDYELEKGDGRVTARFGRCPIYDGLAASGMEHAAIRKICESLSSGESRKFRESFPQVAESTKIRDRPGDLCIEEFVIAK